MARLVSKLLYDAKVVHMLLTPVVSAQIVCNVDVTSALNILTAELQHCRQLVTISMRSPCILWTDHQAAHRCNRSTNTCTAICTCKALHSQFECEVALLKKSSFFAPLSSLAQVRRVRSVHLPVRAILEKQQIISNLMNTAVH
jgi:hypothetical protein